MDIALADLDRLKQAKYRLEHPGVAVKLSNLLGTPLEKGFALMPAGWREIVYASAHKALSVALDGALLTLDAHRTPRTAPGWHRFAAAASGAIGGAFGLSALLLEMPVSTSIMLRSIAEIGRSHGEDLATEESRLACLEVFALGGPAPKDLDTASRSGYFAVRRYLAEKALVEDGAPALAKLVTKIAVRFQVPISEKAAAMAVPVIGALGGAGINLLFIQHFQSISQGHFTVRQLERQYGPEAIREAYEAL